MEGSSSTFELDDGCDEEQREGRSEKGTDEERKEKENGVELTLVPTSKLSSEMERLVDISEEVNEESERDVSGGGRRERRSVLSEFGRMKRDERVIGE